MSEAGRTRATPPAIPPRPLDKLPAGWCWATLAELAAPEKNAVTDGPFGSRLKTEHYTDSGPRVIRLQNVGHFVFKDARAHISESHYASLQRHSARPGDLVIAALGDELPRACVIPEWLGPAIVKADCIRYRPDGAAVLPRFLNYALNAPDTRRRSAAVVHGVGRPRLTLGQIKGISIPVAPLNSQRRIADALDELFSDLDAGVAALERVRQKLKLYRASVLKAAVEGTLTAEWRARHQATEPASELLQRILAERRRRWEAEQLAKFKAKGLEPPKTWKIRYRKPVGPATEGLPALPQGWCWVSWEQVGVSQNGRPFPSRDYQKAGTKLLRPGNLHDAGTVGWTDRNTRFLPDHYAKESGDLLVGGGELVMNLTAQSLKDDFLGRTCLTLEGERCLLNQRLARLTPLIVIPNFMLFVFKSARFRGFVARLNTGSLIQHMFTSQLEEFVFPLPPLAEQEAIVEIVEDQLSVVDHLEADIEAKLESARSLRQAILRHAFSGKLVPQDPNDEPASELLKRIAAEREARVREAAAAKGPGRAERTRTTAKGRTGRTRR